jgi:hypothetical protein
MANHLYTLDIGYLILRYYKRLEEEERKNACPVLPEQTHQNKTKNQL